MNSALSTLIRKGENWWKTVIANRERQKQPGIGIDLGTTYSCVAVWQHGQVEIIMNDLGNRTTPSWVAFTQTNSLIGEAAKNQAPMNSTNTIFETVDKCLNDAKMRKTHVHDIVLVGGSTRIPKVQQLLQDYFNGKELCRNINPDEAVAYGAASHAAILAGVREYKDTVLVDVTPLSLGIEVHDKSMAVCIPRNTAIPTKIHQTHVTVHNNQEAITFSIYEGERFIAKDNHLLGKFTLYNLPPRPKGECKFDVCFDIDADGILTVSANLLGTDNKDQITITEHCGRLTKDEIDRMVKEGEMYKAQDEESKRITKAKMAFEDCIEEVTRKLRVCREMMSEDEKQLIEDAIERTVGWLDWNYLCPNVSLFEQKRAELQSVSDRVFRKKSLKKKMSELNDVD